MGKCILGGHPPVGTGCGFYTGSADVDQTIYLGVTPKWVLVLYMGIYLKNDKDTTLPYCGGLAVSGHPATENGQSVLEIVSGGFKVSRSYPAGTNYNGATYHYIYGT